MKAAVKTNYPYIRAKLKALAPALRPAVAKGLQRGLEGTASLSQRSYLSGPRPARLDVVTTRLRNSIATRVVDDGREITGRIGSNVRYARFHEFGFRGLQNVSAHTRVLKILNRKGQEITGGPLSRKRGVIKDRAGNVVGYKRSMSTAAGLLGGSSVSVQVRAHQRRINYAGRPFIRPALRRTEQSIARSVEAALRTAVRKQNTGTGPIV